MAARSDEEVSPVTKAQVKSHCYHSYLEVSNKWGDSARAGGDLSANLTAWVCPGVTEEASKSVRPAGRREGHTP